MIQAQGYRAAAEALTQQLGQHIDPEQLRGARRRWIARGQREDARTTATDEPRTRKELFVLDTLPVNGTILFGALGDTHIGSKYERTDLIHELYDIYAAEGVHRVFHTGNFIEGESHFNKNDVVVHGMDNQLRYFVENYPVRRGIQTFYIGGDDHEGWYTQREGVDVGERLEDIARRNGRYDLSYLGYMERDLRLSPQSSEIIRVIHPGGGSAQAVSWTSQRLMASVEHDDVMPFIFFVGHYHKSEFLPNYRGAYMFQTGTFQEQSPFMRKKLLRADMGAWIVRITFQDSAPVRIGGEFIPFKKRQWQYR